MGKAKVATDIDMCIPVSEKLADVKSGQFITVITRKWLSPYTYTRERIGVNIIHMAMPRWYDLYFTVADYV